MGLYTRIERIRQGGGYAAPVTQTEALELLRRHRPHFCAEHGESHALWCATRGIRLTDDWWLGRTDGRYVVEFC